MKFSLDRHTANLPALIIAAVLVFSGLAVRNYFQEQSQIEREQARLERINKWRAEREARNAEPIENWIVQRGITVKDYIEGDDTLIFVDRDKIKQPFTANWSVSVIKTDTLTDVCDASGLKVYEAGEILPVAGTKMSSMFSQRPCVLEPGQYVLRGLWQIHRPGYEDVPISRTSIPFNVRPKGAQLFVEPEQVQKLEDIQWNSPAPNACCSSY